MYIYAYIYVLDTPFMLSYFHDVALDAHLFYHVAYVTRAVTTPMQRTQANGRLCGIAASHSGRSELSSMKSTQANGQLSSIAASPSGYGELSSIAVDQPESCNYTDAAHRMAQCGLNVDPGARSEGKHVCSV